MACFGYPQADEHQAERAIRAALNLVETTGRIDTGQPGRLQLRIGVASGLAVVGGQPTALGEAASAAAGLAAAAEPGSVLIAASTRRLVGGLFELCPCEPAEAWQVLAETGVESRFEALRGAALAPLVGREEELELLLRRWEQAKAGSGRVVLVSGEPGIGKSRLARALQDAITGQPHVEVRLFCSPHHQDSTLHPSIAQLERAARFNRDDTEDARLAKLDAVLAQSDATDEAVALIAELLSIPTDQRERIQQMSPQVRRERTLAALLAQLSGLAARQPVLVVYEDVHWIDPSSRELLDRIIDQVARLPVLLLASFRPEFQPPWAGQPNVTSLALGRLDQHDSAALVAGVAGADALLPEVAREIAKRTDGVPLFIEEVTRAVLEAGAQAGALSSIPWAALSVPATLHASLLARLDRLGPVAKEVAQKGAAIGREFGYELLAAIADQPDPELRQALDRLTGAGLLFARGAPPQSTYLFKHALVQDAAYGTLVRNRRQQLHARIAEELERCSPEMVASRPEVLAHHLTEAGLAEQALEFWSKAGTLALARSAPQEATAHFGRALRVAATLPPMEALKRRELALQGGLSAALSLARGLAAPEVEQAQLRARELAAELGDGEGWFRAQWGLWRVHSGRAQTPRALGAAHELLAAAERDRDSGHLLEAQHALWTSLLFRGEFAAARMRAEAGLALYDPDRHGGHAFLYGDHDPGECALSQGGNALWFLGYPEQALRWQDEALALSERLGLPQVLAHTLNWTAIRAQLAGDLPRLEVQVERVTRLAVEHGFANWFPEARILAGWLAAHRDRDRAALGPMRDHMERRSGTGTALASTWLWLVLADACLAVGTNAEAIGAAREGLAGAEATEERFCEAELHRVHAAALLAHDQMLLPAAEQALMAAVKAARGRGARMSELRAAVELARLWAERGARRGAYDLLAPLQGWFTEGLDTPDLREAKRLLDTLL